MRYSCLSSSLPDLFLSSAFHQPYTRPLIVLPSLKKQTNKHGTLETKRLRSQSKISINYYSVDQIAIFPFHPVLF